MKTEYPELNDKAIDISKLGNGQNKTMYVNSCDYSIGISCSSTVGGTHYLMCIWNTEHYKKMFKNSKQDLLSKSAYRKLFHFVVSRLQAGVFTQKDSDYARDLVNLPSVSVGKADCPFNQ